MDPEEELAAMWAHCRKYPWDFDAWSALTLALQKGGDAGRLREGYEELLQEFPLMFNYWSAALPASCRPSVAPIETTIETTV